MVSEIRIYVEGGGNSSATRASVRKGFHKFLETLVECARSKGIRWQIIACGGREQTFENFQLALRSNPEAFNVLLVDAEASVTSAPWQHLYAQDQWRQPHGTADEQCYLMTQNMEAWLIADPDTVATFYGQEFNRNALPVNRNIESVDRETIDRVLAQATQRTQKGAYHKIHHGVALLERINPVRVRAVMPSCDRLFSTLASVMGGCP